MSKKAIVSIDLAARRFGVIVAASPSAHEEVPDAADAQGFSPSRERIMV